MQQQQKTIEVPFDNGYEVEFDPSWLLLLELRHNDDGRRHRC